MTKALGRATSIVALAGLALLVSTSYSETLAPDAKLPDPVDKTFKTMFPGAVIEKVDAEEENGVMVYDFEFKDGDSEKETDIAADGTMLESTLVITTEAVPAAAMKAMKKAAEGATMQRIEHIMIAYETKDGKVVKLAKPKAHFAAELAKGDKRGEIVVTPSGAVVEPVEWVKAPAEKAPEEKPAK